MSPHNLLTENVGKQSEYGIRLENLFRYTPTLCLIHQNTRYTDNVNKPLIEKMIFELHLRFNFRETQHTSFGGCGDFFQKNCFVLLASRVFPHIPPVALRLGHATIDSENALVTTFPQFDAVA